MSPARMLVIASASCMLANAMAEVKELELLTLPNYPGMTAILDYGSEGCADTPFVSVSAFQKSNLADGKAVRKVMAWAQMMVQTECPQSSAIELVVGVDGKDVYKGIARKANGWILTEVKPPQTEDTGEGISCCTSKD